VLTLSMAGEIFSAMLIHNKANHLFRVERQPVPAVAVDLDGNRQETFDVHPRSGEKIPRLQHMQPVLFQPGVSSISRGDWESVMQSQGVQMRLTGKGLTGPIPEGPSLLIISESDDLPRGEAESVHVINHCFDIELLQAWSKEKKLSATVDKAIKLQILKIEDPDKYEKTIAQEESIRRR
jgi:hypothetical protein